MKLSSSSSDAAGEHRRAEGGDEDESPTGRGEESLPELADKAS